MYKHKRIKLTLTSCEHRVQKQELTLYSYDINNNMIEIKVVDECDDMLKLSNYNVEILSVFLKSKQKHSTIPIVEDDKIYFKFDTTLIDRDETVRCHVYLKKEYEDGSVESADVAVFEFRVRLSLKHLELEDKIATERKEEYVHNQTFTSDRWHIVHSLGKIPQVSVLDSSLRVVYGSVQHLNENELVITFSAPFQGRAQLD